MEHACWRPIDGVAGLRRVRTPGALARSSRSGHNPGCVAGPHQVCSRRSPSAPVHRHPGDRRYRTRSPWDRMSGDGMRGRSRPSVRTYTWQRARVPGSRWPGTVRPARVTTDRLLRQARIVDPTSMPKGQSRPRSSETRNGRRSPVQIPATMTGSASMNRRVEEVDPLRHQAIDPLRRRQIDSAGQRRAHAFDSASR